MRAHRNFAPTELAHILLAAIYKHFIPTGFLCLLNLPQRPGGGPFTTAVQITRHDSAFPNWAGRFGT